MAGRLEGKVALITGAARGQGRSHAVTLAQEGADIIAVDISKQMELMDYPTATEEDMRETIDLVEKTGREIRALDVDVRDLPGLTAKVGDAVRELGRLDIVSANAGIGGPTHKCVDFSDELWRLMLDVNLTGVWHTAKVAVPHLRAGGRGGSIALTCSMAGLRAYDNLGHYTAAKHGVLGLMRSLALELGPEGIRVNSLHPTAVPTPFIMNEPAMRLFLPDAETPTVEDFAAVAQTLNVMPVPWVEPIDVSNALLFLASEDARYITGVALPIDAGCMLK